MNKQTKIIGALLGAALATASGVAVAESSYGYQTSGSGAVTATARVNLSITVPKLILLRVGSDNTTIDTLSWPLTPTWVTAPGTLTSGTSSQNTAWNGAAPTFPVTSATSTLAVYAWTNGPTATINCGIAGGLTSTPAVTGGPTMTDIEVVTGGTTPLPHPGANLGSCASTAFTSNSLYSGTWIFSLAATATPASWPAGTYTGQVTYTASTI